MSKAHHATADVEKADAGKAKVDKLRAAYEKARDEFSVAFKANPPAQDLRDKKEAAFKEWLAADKIERDKAKQPVTA